MYYKNTDCAELQQKRQNLVKEKITDSTILSNLHSKSSKNKACKL